MKMSLEERIESKSMPEPNSGCTLWIGTLNNFGYPMIGSREFGTQLVHRLNYTLKVGPIPDGLVLDHLCRTPACINPVHLEPVTYAENSRRGATGSKKACKRGHVFDEANTYYPPAGKGEWRACRTCVSEANARSYARRKLAAAS